MAAKMKAAQHSTGQQAFDRGASAPAEPGSTAVQAGARARAAQQDKRRTYGKCHGEPGGVVCRQPSWHQWTPSEEADASASRQPWPHIRLSRHADHHRRQHEPALAHAWLRGSQWAGAAGQSGCRWCCRGCQRAASRVLRTSTPHAWHARQALCSAAGRAHVNAQRQGVRTGGVAPVGPVEARQQDQVLRGHGLRVDTAKGERPGALLGLPELRDDLAHLPARVGGPSAVQQSGRATSCGSKALGTAHAQQNMGRCAQAVLVSQSAAGGPATRSAGQQRCRRGLLECLCPATGRRMLKSSLQPWQAGVTTLGLLSRGRTRPGHCACSTRQSRCQCLPLQPGRGCRQAGPRCAQGPCAVKLRQRHWQQGGGSSGSCGSDSQGGGGGGSSSSSGSGQVAAPAPGVEICTALLASPPAGEVAQASCQALPAGVDSLSTGSACPATPQHGPKPLPSLQSSSHACPDRGLGGGASPRASRLQG